MADEGPKITAIGKGECSFDSALLSVKGSAVTRWLLRVFLDCFFFVGKIFIWFVIMLGLFNVDEVVRVICIDGSELNLNILNRLYYRISKFLLEICVWLHFYVLLICDYFLTKLYFDFYI